MRKKAVFVGIFIFIYLLLAAWDYYGPGIANEECVEPIAAMQLIKGDPCWTYFSFSGLPLFTNNSYFGSIQTYLLIPFFAVLGATLFAARVYNIIFGLGILVMSYLFCKKFFNEGIAFICSLLLISQPGFIIFSKTLLFSDGILNLIMLGSLFFYLSYVEEKQVAYFYLFSFITGIGLWTKIVFLLYMIPVIVSAAAIFRKEFSLLNRRKIFAGVGFFFVGSAPLWYMNIVKHGETFGLLLSSLLNGTRYGFNNLSFLNNFYIRIRQFSHLFAGVGFDRLSPDLELYNPLYIYSMISALGILAAGIIFNKLGEYRKKTVLIMALFIFIFTGLCFTLTVLREYHLFFLVPLPQILLSVAIYSVYNTAAYRMRSKIIPAAVVSAVLLPVLIYPRIVRMKRTVFERHAMLSGGSSERATFDIIDILEKKAVKSVILLDSSEYMDHNIYFLTGGKVIPYTVMTVHENRKTVRGQLKEYFYYHGKQGRVYIITGTGQGNARQIKRLLDFLGESEYVKSSEKEFKNREDRPIFKLLEYEKR